MEDDYKVTWQDIEREIYSIVDFPTQYLDLKIKYIMLLIRDFFLEYQIDYLLGDY